MANPKTGSPGSQPYQLGPARHHSGPAPSPARQPCHPWRDVCDRVAPLTSGGGQAGFSHGGSSPCPLPPCPLPGGSRLHKAVWTEVSPARLQLRPRGQGHRDVTQPCHRRPSQPACKVFQLLYCRESAAGSVCAGVTLTVLRLSEDLARLWETERSADRPPGSLAYVGERHVCAATGRALPPGPQPGVGEQMSRPLHFPGRPSPSPTEGHRPDTQTETDSPALTMRLREGS